MNISVELIGIWFILINDIIILTKLYQIERNQKK